MPELQNYILHEINDYTLRKYKIPFEIFIQEANYQEKKELINKLYKEGLLKPEDELAEIFDMKSEKFINKPNEYIERFIEHFTEIYKQALNSAIDQWFGLKYKTKDDNLFQYLFETFKEYIEKQHERVFSGEKELER